MQLWSQIVVLVRLFIQLNKHKILKDAKTKKKKEIELFRYDSYNLIAIKLVISILNHYVKVNSC